MVQGFLDGAQNPTLAGPVVAVVAPHAGFVYSGKVAGASFRALKDSAVQHGAPETAVVLGFSHRRAFSGVAFMDGTAMETPLGSTPLDAKSTEYLVRKGRFLHVNYLPHDGEHSAENLIPFVQAALPDTKLVVALIGAVEQAVLDDLVAALVELSKQKRIVVVSSSDMLHDPDWRMVTQTDQATLKKVEAMDHAGLLGEWSHHNQTFCGIGPVVTAMRYAQAHGVSKGTVLTYRNSGDDFPDSRGQWVVGYGAVAFTASKP